MLRPAMWRANADALRAGFGHRHTARRGADDAIRNVGNARAGIAVVRTEGAEARRQLETLQTEAMGLEHLANPAPYGISVDQPDRVEFERTDLLIVAIDTWTTWAAGRRVPTHDLGTAVDAFAEAAQQSRQCSLGARCSQRSPWQVLLVPMAAVLPEFGVSSRSTRAAKVDHEPSFGIDL